MEGRRHADPGIKFSPDAVGARTGPPLTVDYIRCRWEIAERCVSSRWNPSRFRGWRRPSAGWPSAWRGSCVVQSDCFTPAFPSRMDTTPSPHSTQEGARRSTTPPLAELGSSQRSTTPPDASAFAPLSADELGASQQPNSNIPDPLVASRVLPQGSTFNSAVSTTRCSATPPSHSAAARVAFTSPLATAAAGSGVASSGIPALSTAARSQLPASPPLAESALDATVAAARPADRLAADDRSEWWARSG